MNPAPLALVIPLTLVALSIAWSDEPRNPPPATEAKPAADRPAELPTLNEARRQAEALHTVIHSTLHLVHHEYYREDEGLPLPAAALKEVFAELEKEQRIRLRWLAVEGQAMNVDHKARGEFEEAAFQALKSGQPHYERVEQGVYRRAAAITLTNQCLKCHVPDRKSTRNRTAGLILSVPVRDD